MEMVHSSSHGSGDLMSTEIERAAVHAIRTWGSIQSALGNLNFPQDLREQLRGMYIECPRQLLKVHGGSRMIHRGSRDRFIMTHIGLVVNVDTGHTLAYRDLPFPLEVYRYGRG